MQESMRAPQSFECGSPIRGEVAALDDSVQLWTATEAFQSLTTRFNWGCSFGRQYPALDDNIQLWTTAHAFQSLLAHFQS